MIYINDMIEKPHDLLTWQQCDYWALGITLLYIALKGENIGQYLHMFPRDDLISNGLPIDQLISYLPEKLSSNPHFMAVIGSLVGGYRRRMIDFEHLNQM